MSLKVIAALAGVSVSTVSKAFADSSEVSAETKKKILEIAKKQGIFIKYNKIKYDRKVIAVICPEVNSEYYSRMLTILEEEIRNQGGIMTVSVSNFSSERIQELFAYYSFYCVVDGIIVVNNNALIDNSQQIPAVSIEPLVECPSLTSIHVDNQVATEAAILHLKELGHTRIGFAGEELTTKALANFKTAMMNVGLSIESECIKVSSKRFEQAGSELAEEWLAMSEPPTAIMAAYDYIAIGIINSFQQHGYRVPEDISVIGMNDIGLIPYLTTPLSTIRNHTEEACKLAAESIMGKINRNEQVIEEKMSVTSDFVARKSSGKVKKNDDKSRLF